MNNQLSIKVDRNTVTLQDDDILYIKSRRDYMLIVTSSKRYMTYSTTKAMAAKVNAVSFARVHRSYIINLTKAQVVGNTIVLNDGIEIPISRTYKPLVLARMAG